MKLSRRGAMTLGAAAMGARLPRLGRADVTLGAATLTTVGDGPCPARQLHL